MSEHFMLLLLHQRKHVTDGALCVCVFVFVYVSLRGRLCLLYKNKCDCFRACVLLVFVCVGMGKVLHLF